MRSITEQIIFIETRMRYLVDFVGGTFDMVVDSKRNSWMRKTSIVLFLVYWNKQLHMERT